MLIKLRVKTGAKHESIKKVADDHYEISVKEKPRDNLANARVLFLLAHELKTVKKPRIVKGHHSPSKIVAID